MKDAHFTALTLGAEIIFASILIIVAGSSDDAGKVVVLFLVGLWLVFMVAHPVVFTRINDSVNRIVKGAAS